MTGKESALEYVQKKGYFDQANALDIINIGSEVEETEGYVNLLYRIQDPDSRESIIVKRIMPYLVKIKEEKGIEIPINMDRLKKESQSMQFLKKFTGNLVPEIYAEDEDYGVLLMEDVGHLELMRYVLTHQETVDGFGKRMGTLLASLRFFTSELFLPPEVKASMEVQYENEDGKKILSDIALGDTNPIFNLSSPLGKNASIIRAKLYARSDLREIVRALQKKYLDSSECLCHNDLHAGNVMVGDEEIKLIDFEFCGYSSSFMDMGRLISSFIIHYFYYLGRPDLALENRISMQHYCLQVIKELMKAYESTLKMYEKAFSVPASQNLEEIIRTFRADTLRCAVLSCCFRVTSDSAKSCDIERVKDPKLLDLIQCRALQLAEIVIFGADSIDSIDAFCSILSYFGDVTEKENILS